MAKLIRNGRFIEVTKEASEQMDIVSKEVGKLADLSHRSWDLLTTSAYRRVKLTSAFIGASSVAAAIGLTKLVKKIRKNRKDKQEPESE